MIYHEVRILFVCECILFVAHICVYIDNENIYVYVYQSNCKVYYTQGHDLISNMLSTCRYIIQ